MKKKKAVYALIISISSVVLIFVLVFLSYIMRPSIDIIKYGRSGGIQGSIDYNIVFRENGKCYLYDMENFYLIPTGMYNNVAYATARLHLKDINGYRLESPALSDGFGSSFYVGYEDGSYTSGSEYGKYYPKDHNASQIGLYFSTLFIRIPVERSVKIDETFYGFSLAGKDEEHQGLVGLKRVSQYEYFVYYQTPGFYAERQITQADREALFERAVSLYEASDGDVDINTTNKPYLTMNSEVWNSVDVDLSSQSQEALTLFEEIENLVK